MNNPSEKRTSPRVPPHYDPRDAWDHNPPDPSSLEFFKGPFDPIDYKDGRKLSEEEEGIRLIAYLAQFGSEVYTKNPRNCDDYWTSDPNDPSFTTAAKQSPKGSMPDFDFSAAWEEEMERRKGLGE